MKRKIFEEIKQAMFNYEKDRAKQLATLSLEKEINPLETIEIFNEAITIIGTKFSEGELWLPDLMLAADTMKGAIDILEKTLKDKGFERKSSGKIVLGTVFGDIHDIGKNLVGTLLISGGFEVIDMGVNVEAKKFIDVVRKEKPKILALSSLLTTTAPEQQKIMKALKDESLRKDLKVIIGGGSITKEFADSIGADGYEPTAPLALNLVKRLIN